MNLRILCLSDTHGELTELDLSRIDLVLHAGDYSCTAKHDTYKQLAYFEQVFCPWVRRISDSVAIYYIDGNHETYREFLTDYTNDVIEKHNINNRQIMFKGKNIYGFPWTNRFHDWAFNADDTPEDMGRRCEQIPLETDILLSHGPPYGIMDRVPGRIALDWNTGEPIEIPAKRAGSKELARRINEVKPKMVVFGHLHSNYGVDIQDGFVYVGCSLADESYRFYRKPVIVTLPI